MRVRPLTAFALLAPLLLPAGSTAAAQGLTRETKFQVVEAAAKVLREGYVYPEVGERTAIRLSATLAAGGYDTIEDPVAFASRLSADMRDVAHDDHLNIFAQNGPGPGDELGPEPPQKKGFVRVDRLPGNVGYIKVVGFPNADGIKPMADAAMRMVARTKAVIIDVRQNFGGNPTGVAYLVSFFLGGRKQVHLNDVVWRDSGTNTTHTDSTWTSATPTHYLGRPVYVLTGRQTFSAGEEFAYDLQALNRATLVGEVTRGGANPGTLAPLASGFDIFIPTGRAENPITKTNWEGRGVRPDVRVPAGAALKVALRRLGVAARTDDVSQLSIAKLFEAQAK